MADVLAGWEEWTDAHRPGWRDERWRHPDWVHRAVYAQYVDGVANRVPLTEGDRAWVRLALADGPRPYREVVRLSGLDRRTTRRALQSLVSRGAVRTYKVPGRPRPAHRPPRREMRVYVLR